MSLDNIWYVLRVKAQHELKVVSNLDKMGLNSCAPHIEEIRQWSDRKKKIKKPLISRHVFVQLSIKDEFKVFSSNGVLGYLNLQGKRAKVLDKEINILKNYCNQKYNQKICSIGNKIKTPVLEILTPGFEPFGSSSSAVSKPILAIKVPSVNSCRCILYQQD